MFQRFKSLFFSKKTWSSQDEKETSASAESCEESVCEDVDMQGDAKLIKSHGSDSSVWLNIEMPNAEEQGLVESDSIVVIETSVTTDLETKNQMEISVGVDKKTSAMQNTSDVGLESQATGPIPVKAKTAEKLIVDDEKQTTSNADLEEQATEPISLNSETDKALDIDDEKQNTSDVGLESSATKPIPVKPVTDEALIVVDVKQNTSNTDLEERATEPISLKTETDEVLGVGDEKQNTSNVGLKSQAAEPIPVKPKTDEALGVDDEKQNSSDAGLESRATEPIPVKPETDDALIVDEKQNTSNVGLESQAIEPIPVKPETDEALIVDDEKQNTSDVGLESQATEPISVKPETDEALIVDDKKQNTSNVGLESQATEPIPVKPETDEVLIVDDEKHNTSNVGLESPATEPIPVKPETDEVLDAVDEKQNTSNEGLISQATGPTLLKAMHDNMLSVDDEKKICSEMECPTDRFELALVTPLPETPLVCRTSARTSVLKDESCDVPIPVTNLFIKSDDELQKDEDGPAIGNEKTMIESKDKTAVEKSDREILEQFRKLEDIALLTPLPPTPVAGRCRTQESMNEEVADKSSGLDQGDDCVAQQIGALQDENIEVDTEIKDVCDKLVDNIVASTSEIQIEENVAAAEIDIVTTAAEFTANGLLVFPKKLIYELGYKKDLPADEMESVIQKQYEIAANTKNVKWISDARYFAEVLFSKNWIDQHLPVITKDGRKKRSKKEKKNKRQQERNDVYLEDEYMYRDVRLKTDPNLETVCINASSSQNVDHRQKPYDRPARKTRNEKSADGPTSPIGKDVALEQKGRRKNKRERKKKTSTDSVESESSKSETSQTESQIDLKDKISDASEPIKEESVEKNIFYDESKSLQYTSSFEEEPSTETTSSDRVVVECTDKAVLCSVIEQGRKTDSEIVNEDVSDYKSEHSETEKCTADVNECTKSDVTESCLIKETEKSLNIASEQVVMEVFDRALREFDSSSETDIVKNNSDNKLCEGTNEDCFPGQLSDKNDEYLQGAAEENI